MTHSLDEIQEAECDTLPSHLRVSGGGFKSFVMLLSGDELVSSGLGASRPAII